MNFRYHAWMTRSISGQCFTLSEHFLYACCAVSLGFLVIGAFILAFMHPSAVSFVLAMFAAGLAWWIMSRTHVTPPQAA